MAKVIYRGNLVLQPEDGIMVIQTSGVSSPKLVDLFYFHTFATHILPAGLIEMTVLLRLLRIENRAEVEKCW
jgi:hypothetical protein